MRACFVLFVGLLATFGVCHGKDERVARPPVVVPYTLATAGQVSAAIYGPDGQVVRELLHAVPQIAGKHALVWDGLDREGVALPLGRYTWKLLQTPGLRATYQLSVGGSYPPGEGWRHLAGPGTHGVPGSVAVDASGIYVAANTTENIETCVLKMTPDGQTRLWSALHPTPWDGAISMALDGGELFMLGHGVWEGVGQRVFVLDAATGKLAPRFQVDKGRGPQPYGFVVAWDPASKEVEATDMDCAGGVLVVAYATHDTLRWYDPHTGKLLGSAAVPAPQGVAVGPEGQVIVSSGEQVLTLSLAAPTPVVLARGLAKPGRVARDPSSGDLFVYLQATKQVARLSVTGDLRQTYGQDGGRQPGLYDDAAKRSFAGFSDLCADGAGGFFVTEASAAPRRTVHFAADGAVLREWYGGQRWAPHAALEGDNPNVLWVTSQYGWVMRVLVDYAARTWTVHSCYSYTDLANGLVGDSHNEGGYFRVYQHAGSTYLALEKLPTILKVDEAHWRLQPVTVCGNLWGAPKYLTEWAKGAAAYQWNDANGDGLPQREEVQFYATGIPSSWEPTIAADFTCYAGTGDQHERWVNAYAVTGWNAVGAPLYGTLPRGTRTATLTPRFTPTLYSDPRWSLFLQRDARSGRLTAAINSFTRTWGVTADSFMQQWHADGTPAWVVGQQGPLPGEVHHNYRGIAGMAHNCVVAIDFDGGWNMANLASTYVYDEDGLFVGGLMDHPNLDGRAAEYYQLGGELCHSALHELPSGDVLFYGNWENEMRVYQVSGWGGWQRQTGTFTLTQPATSHTGQGLTTTTFRDAAHAQLAAVAVTPTLDLQWAQQPPAAITFAGTLLPTYGPAYTGTWEYTRDKVHTARDGGSQVCFRFRGGAIAVYGGHGPNFGFADIVLDGTLLTTADCYSPTASRHELLYAQSALPPGEHELVVKVRGWHGAPRNRASTDSVVTIEQFEVDGQVCDNNGLAYTFSADADGQLAGWINRQPVFQDHAARAQRAPVPGITLQLLRQPTPIQISYRGGQRGGGLRVLWSSPLEPTQVIPTTALYPVLPGGYTQELLPAAVGK